MAGNEWELSTGEKFLFFCKLSSYEWKVGMGEITTTVGRLAWRRESACVGFCLESFVSFWVEFRKKLFTFLGSVTGAYGDKAF